MIGALLLALLVIAVLAHMFGRARSRRVAGDYVEVLNSQPHHHGAWLALVVAGPSLVVVALWGILAPTLRDRVTSWLGPGLRDAWTSDALLRTFALPGLVTALVLLGGLVGMRAITPGFRARARVEGAIRAVTFLAAATGLLLIATLLVTFGFEGARFLARVSIRDVVFGADGVTALSSLMAGTLLVALVACLLAAPFALVAIVWLGELASPRAQRIGAGLFRALAAIPPIVYGFVALTSLASVAAVFGAAPGVGGAMRGIVAISVAVGLMILPLWVSHGLDALSAVPASLRAGSTALGATRAETAFAVALPAAAPGLVAAMLAALGRAMGETMIVLMVGGLNATLAGSTTLAAHIARLFIASETPAASASESAAFLGLVLLTMTILAHGAALLLRRASGGSDD